MGVKQKECRLSKTDEDNNFITLCQHLSQELKLSKSFLRPASMSPSLGSLPSTARTRRSARVPWKLWKHSVWKVYPATRLSKSSDSTKTKRYIWTSSNANFSMAPTTITKRLVTSSMLSNKSEITSKSKLSSRPDRQKEWNSVWLTSKKK